MVEIMKVIIPAKANSQRVAEKNWRPFNGGDCLVDVTIKKLLDAGLNRHEIHVSCECQDRLDYAVGRWDVRPLLRPEELCANEVPLTTWIREITSQVEGDRPILWAQVTDPFFDEYRECIETWRLVSNNHDSLVVTYGAKRYLMMESGSTMQPVGWSFGEHHTPSQHLPTWYEMPFTLSVLTREAIASTGYHVGRQPYWYVADGYHIDIDTREDFAIAAAIYENRESIAFF